MDFKRNVPFNLFNKQIISLDKLAGLENVSRAELGRRAVEHYLSQKKIKEMLTSS